MNKFGNFKNKKVKGFKIVLQQRQFHSLLKEQGKDEINDARCFMFNVSLPSSLYLN